MIYFDVRPSAHLPTVELRICDACARLEDVVLLAGLFPRAGHPGDRRRAGGPGGAERPPELLEAATWRAAQSGLDGNLVDPATAIPVPAHQLIGQLLADPRPMLESTGDWELTAELTKSALAGGSSAARQRRPGQGRRHAAAGNPGQHGLAAGRGIRPRDGQRVAAGPHSRDGEAVLFDGSACGLYGMILPALDKIGVDGLCGRHTCRDEIQRRVGSSSGREGQDQLSAGSAHDHLGYRAVPVSGPGNCLSGVSGSRSRLADPPPRFRFTPTGSSSINQVSERWFGYLTAQKIRHGVHKSVQALEADIRAWIENWNQNPRPFTWTKTAEEIWTHWQIYR